MLKALVVIPNEKTKEVGTLLAVARAEARKREHTQQNPPIRALVFVPELQVYCAIYEVELGKAAVVPEACNARHTKSQTATTRRS